SQPGIVNGTNLAGGNIEFWPNNYAADNTANVPNANGLTLDWGDSRSAGNYGSMQIHNHDAGQVLFAFNRWGGVGGRADLGIGTRPSGGDPDWTFAQNAATYAVKTLQVLVNLPPVAKCADVIVAAGTNCMAEASADNGSFNPDGDAFTVTQSPPGPYPLGTNLVTVTITDRFGVSNSCAASVIVLDTTPPVITCPSNLTIEFTSEAGAPATFNPGASDLCSPPVNITCVPPSGSTFAIGNTEVRCTATDSAGNAAECGFQVTVLGAQGVKSNVLAQLIALRGSLSDPRGLGALGEAIGYLSRSLEGEMWLDQTHLAKRLGARVFQDDRAAVQVLGELLGNRHRGGSSYPTLPGLIERILKADRLLAVVAIQEASGADGWRLDQARYAVAQGDQDAGNASYAVALQHYLDAWQIAIRLTIKVGGRVVDGRLRLELPAMPGERYQIEASTNLDTWVTVGTTTAGEDGWVRFDPVSGGHGQAQFYRAKLLP
ncbi:MAG: HYR domain-containing protein, partial [Verrucomicrobia bacterium]|nr:HYR domain-containing protein [Verrucomicrobiota bacterium]